MRRMEQSVVCRHVQHACRDGEQHRVAHLSVEGASKGVLLELQGSFSVNSVKRALSGHCQALSGRCGRR
jgi:hypothetical protein